MDLSASKARVNGPFGRRKARRRAGKPRLAAFIALTVSGMIGGLVVLAGHTIVPQITRAPGVVIPLGSYTRIESTQGGVVTALHVGDGEAVDAGALLLELENPDLSREAQSLFEERSGLQQQLDNAQAILRVLDAAAVDPSDIKTLHSEGLSQAAARLAVHMESQRIKLASIEQQETTKTIVEDALAFAVARAERKKDDLARERDLLARGLIKQSQLAAVEDQADALQAAASEAAVRLAQESKALMEARAAHLNETLALREETIRRIAELKPELARISSEEKIVHQKMDDLRVTAPASGVVQSVVFPSVGEVIGAGETVFELLPQRNTLIVEARIPNIDVGHIAREQSVAITFDSFDARRFGKAEGALTSVSPVPLTDETNGSQYFRAAISLPDDTIGTGAYERPITAGLTVVAEMVTGEQTLLGYFLKPVQHTLNTAFTER